MYDEVGYPDAWPAVDGSGRALPGDELRATLGLAGRTRDGLDSRILAPGDTLTLYLPGPAGDLNGTVTADQSAAAWTLSGLDFASSTYTRMVSDIDDGLGDKVRTAREALMAELTSSPAAESPDSDSTSDSSGSSGSSGSGDQTDGADLSELRLCLSSVADTILMNPDVAKQLTGQTASCTPSLLRPALSGEDADGPAEMADGVASKVLEELPDALKSVTEPWKDVPDALTDEHAGFQVWLGPPPVQDYDYTDKPSVFTPGDDVDVDEWDQEFNAYVAHRLDQLVEHSDAEQAQSTGIVVGTSCPEGQVSVRRYRTDGFALADVVTCGGDSFSVVLGKEGDGWQELDSVKDGEPFGCGVMGNYSVPAFIAGDTCVDGDKTQEYTG
jgi:hypothetical protein